MSKPARRSSWLTAVVAAAVVVVGPAAVVRADDEYAPGPRTVQVGPGRFKNETTRVLSGHQVTFVLKDDVEYGHVIAFGQPPSPGAPTQYELDPANPAKRSFTVTFAQAGVHDYRCTLHPHRGTIKVRAPLPATTTTTARPAATEPKVVAAGSTSQPGVLVPADAKATSTTTTAPVLVPSPIVTLPPPAAPTTTVTAPEDAEDLPVERAGADSAAVAIDDPLVGEDGAVVDSTALLALAAGLGAALLGAAGWAWYHRPSRYQPA